jgi:hypothetical protein
MSRSILRCAATAAANDVERGLSVKDSVKDYIKDKTEGSNVRKRITSVFKKPSSNTIDRRVDADAPQRTRSYLLFRVIFLF